MKAKKWIPIAILAVAALILVSGCFYTVAEDEYACTFRFSKIINVTGEAGLHFKLPFVDSVSYFTKATQLYDIPPSEVLTSDKQNMTVDCYILWSIDDPKQFYKTLGSRNNAEDRLDALTYNELKTVMGTLAQADIINMEDGAQRNDISAGIASDVDALARTYGIRVEDVNIIVSDAQAQAATLVAEGEGEYMRMLAAAYDTPDKKDFYEFTLALDALKSSLNGTEKTVILDANSSLAQILMGAK